MDANDDGQPSRADASAPPAPEWQPKLVCQGCGAQNIPRERVRPDGTHLNYRVAGIDRGQPCGPVRVIPTRWHYYIVALLTIAGTTRTVANMVTMEHPIADISHIKGIEALIVAQVHVQENDEQTGHVIVGADAKVQKAAVIVGITLLRQE
jgi:hypothetical protein